MTEVNNRLVILTCRNIYKSIYDPANSKPQFTRQEVRRKLRAIYQDPETKLFKVCFDMMVKQKVLVYIRRSGINTALYTYGPEKEIDYEPKRSWHRFNIPFPSSSREYKRERYRLMMKELGREVKPWDEKMSAAHQNRKKVLVADRPKTVGELLGTGGHIRVSSTESRVPGFLRLKK